MLINLNTVLNELPALKDISVDKLCEDLAALGFPVDEVKACNGSTVLDIDVTPNRGDAQSHYGIARDLAAKLGMQLRSVPRPSVVEGEPALFVRLEALGVAPVYSTAVLEVEPINNDVVPETVKALLSSLNVSVKGLPAVDASNEILHLYGQPTHAFDADLVQGDISVRWARDGESLVTMDMVERRLTDKDLIIADSVGPISMAGLIGGNSTKVSATTRRLMLESAFFDPRTVRAMSYRHDLHTDASQRFGRGVDPEFAIVARDLLVCRLQDWAGARLQSAWTVGNVPLAANTIHMPWTLLDLVVGYRIDRFEVVYLLQLLGCIVYSYSDKLIVKTPSWRHDLNIAVDLVEEILRLKGYETIPLVIPQLHSAPVQFASDYIKRRSLTSRLASLGFFQTVTMSFVGSGESCDSEKEETSNRSELRTLKNPLSENYSVMRESLLPDLVRVAKLNLERGVKEVRFFEIAPVFKTCCDKSIEEIWTLGIVWGGESGGNDPLSKVRDIGKVDGKSFLIGILKSIGVTDASMLGFDNWQMFGYKDGFKKRLGWQFEIPIYLIPNKDDRVIPKFVPFSRLPIMERDLSLIVSLDQSYNTLRNAVVNAMNDVGAPLHDLRCVDVFRHKSLPHGRQAWLFRLCFQAVDHTLTKEEVDSWMDLALATVKSFGAELRG